MNTMVSVYKGYMYSGGGIPVLLLVIVFGVMMQGTSRDFCQQFDLMRVSSCLGDHILLASVVARESFQCATRFLHGSLCWTGSFSSTLHLCVVRTHFVELPFSFLLILSKLY